MARHHGAEKPKDSNCMETPCNIPTGEITGHRVCCRDSIHYSDNRGISTEGPKPKTWGTVAFAIPVEDTIFHMVDTSYWKPGPRHTGTMVPVMDHGSDTEKVHIPV